MFTASEDKLHMLMILFNPSSTVIPAKAGIHFNHENLWIPAFAGMTDFLGSCFRFDRENDEPSSYATVG